MADKVKLRLMTYNIGGGRKDVGSSLSNITAVIRSFSPDILAIQEAVNWEDLDGNFYNTSTTIADSLDYEFFYFGPTLSMSEEFHVNKSLFAYYIFNDKKEWQQGNGLISRKPFLRLGDPSRRGDPRNIPLYRTLQYRGYRDTESRFILLTRVDQGSIQPFVLATHLTTLVGERGGEKREVPEKSLEAQKLRLEQGQHLIDLVKTHLLDKGELVFLLGDFNAPLTEPCISYALEKVGGFTPLIPENNIPTHIKVPYPVDHIFVHSGNRRVEYKCWVVDDQFNASDHHPVVADVTVYDKRSGRFQELGPGIVKIS